MAHELHDFIGPHSKFWSIIHGPVEVETVLLATIFFFFFREVEMGVGVSLFRDQSQAFTHYERLGLSQKFRQCNFGYICFHIWQ